MARNEGGFTLPELLVTCILCALVGAVALPGGVRLLADARAERTLHRLDAGLAYARMLAVHEGAPMVLCHLDAAGRCDGAWSEGFAIFRDPDRRARLAPGQQPLRVFPGGRERVALRAFRTRRYFRFMPSGRTDWQNGRFVVCPAHEALPVRGIVLNVQGRGRIVRELDDGGVC